MRWFAHCQAGAVARPEDVCGPKGRFIKIKFSVFSLVADGGLNLEWLVQKASPGPGEILMLIFFINRPSGEKPRT